MDDKIDAAIEKMADQVRACNDPTKSQQYSQAALNLAHTKQILEGKTTKSKGAGA